MGKGIYVRQKKITLTDVAKEAGCSVSAVSFVINRSHPISEELQKKVYRAIEKLNYHPYGCRELPPRQWIALITRGPTNTCINWTNAIQRYGYLCRYCCIAEDIKGKELLQQLSIIGKDNQLAGIINLHSFVHSVDLLRRCKDIPSVIFSREGSMLSEVTLPFNEFGSLAARLLLERGHRKTGLIFYFTCYDQESKINLYDAFTTTFSASGSVEKIAIDGERPIEEQLWPQLDQAFASGTKSFFIPDGLFLTESFLRWAYKKRLFIPDDVSVLVQELDDYTHSFAPALSTINWPLDDMADATMRGLIAKIEGRYAESVVYHPVFNDAGSIAVIP